MGRKIVFNKGVQEVITTLYEKQGEKFMKVELQISETYEEEKLIVQAPQSTDKVQKVIEFAENLDLTEKIKGKIDNQVYLVEIGRIQRFYIENRKVLAETASQTYSIDLRLYQVLEILPTTFIQIWSTTFHFKCFFSGINTFYKRFGIIDTNVFICF